jgi:hypothetical protein
MRLIGTVRRIVIVLRELEQLSLKQKNQLLTVCKFSIKMRDYHAIMGYSLKLEIYAYWKNGRFVQNGQLWRFSNENQRLVAG